MASVAGARPSGRLPSSDFVRAAEGVTPAIVNVFKSSRRELGGLSAMHVHWYTSIWLGLVVPVDLRFSSLMLHSQSSTLSVFCQYLNRLKWVNNIKIYLNLDKNEI